MTNSELNLGSGVRPLIHDDELDARLVLGLRGTENRAVRN
jgi:hypothetical protein